MNDSSQNHMRAVSKKKKIIKNTRTIKKKMLNVDNVNISRNHYQEGCSVTLAVMCSGSKSC